MMIPGQNTRHGHQGKTVIFRQKTTVRTKLRDSDMYSNRNKAGRASDIWKENKGVHAMVVQRTGHRQWGETVLLRKKQDRDNVDRQ
jgi:hypothetical protein